MSRERLPRANEILIFFTRLDRELPEPARLEDLLSHSELERAARLPEGPARSRFAAGRLFLRESLASFLDVHAGDIRFVEDEWGKPRLVQGSGAGALTFNLSHSADLAVLAVAGGPEVGVDMERTAEDLPYLEMARLFFSKNELGELTSLPKSAQISAFYRCWTRKEAYLKGCGRGLSLPPHSFDVSLLPGHTPALLVHRLSPSEKERWCIVDINAPQGFCAALAVECVLPVIRYITFE